MDKHDQRDRRCPMLGHDIHFSYCRCPGRDLPCRKVFDCWWETFDVQDFIEHHFSAEQIEQILASPPGKTTTIVDLINQARQRTNQNNSDQ